MKRIIVIFFLLIGLVSFEQTGNRQLFANIKQTTGGGGGGLTPPSFIAKSETSWSVTTTPKTAGFSVNAGDIIVLYAISEAQAASFTVSVGTNTYTSRQTVSFINFTKVQIWTATAAGTASLTLTFTNGGTTMVWGGAVLVFRGSGGVGASSQTTNASGAPSLGLTTTSANSAIVVVNGDWQAVDGASRTWRTENSITPTSGNGLETTYSMSAAKYTVYAAYYSDAGAAAAKTVGLSAPGAQKYSIAAIEIKGQ
jgi:hypothetical protein